MLKKGKDFKLIKKKLKIFLSFMEIWKKNKYKLKKFNKKTEKLPMTKEFQTWSKVRILFIVDLRFRGLKDEQAQIS